jgi:predicted RND superfamily exporter protein
MWTPISSFIIKNRLLLIIVLGIITIFMGYKATQVEMTYDFVKVVPQTDPDLQYYEEFRANHGEDGNILVLGLKDDKLLSLKNFQAYYELCHTLKKEEGVKDVISLPTIKTLFKNTETQKFEQREVFSEMPTTQEELDQKMREVGAVKLFEGQFFNPQTNATLIAITIDKDYLNSARRTGVVDDIMALSESFSEKTSIKMHYAGLPYVRAIMIKEVQGEFKLFLGLAALVTSMVLFFFFRSWQAVVLTFAIIATAVVWTMGTLVLFGYKVTLLTGILPSLIIVISIPNCIYMFNKFHQEYKKHRNKVKAVTRTIQKIGALTIMTNTTTAIGFFVLYFADITILKEFGLVASVVTLSIYLVTTLIIPSLLFYLPAPNAKQLKHLDLGFLRKVINFLKLGALRHRTLVFSVTIILLCIALFGATKVRSVSYMVDDLPSKSDVKSDLVFMEENFGGVMPLEIMIDLKKPKSVLNLNNLKKLEEFETYLSSLEDISKPLSILNVVKGATQAFYNGNPAEYRLPTNNERMFILKYLGNGDDNKNILRALVDSSGQHVRFSVKVADLGSEKMDKLLNLQILPKAKEIFADTGFEVRATGTTLLFLKGNKFLIDGLQSSLMLAILLISIIMAFLFRKFKMVVISLVPNLIPLILTVGIMGIFSIPLKPSTALIFSIAFGIAVDDSIHFLSRYRQELKIFDGNVLKAVTKTLEETGVSMIYTSIVLFFGFVIFAFSSFGGTVALGILTSITLVCAMITNLTILPALVITTSKGGYRNNLFSILSNKSRFYTEDEDEEIDLTKLRLQTKTELQTKAELQGEKV